jgi:hypothetical protein
VQIILFFLLLSSLALAQEDCHPLEGERECYNLLCNAKSANPYLINEQDQSFKTRSGSFSLSEKTIKDIDRLINVTDTLKASVKKALSRNEVGLLADELIGDPIRAMGVLQTLFADDVKCIYKEKKCHLIKSNMTKYPEGFQNYFLQVHELRYPFSSNVAIPLDDKLAMINSTLEKTRSLLSKERYAEEKDKLSKIKDDVSFLSYALNARWRNYFEKTKVVELKSYKADVEAALKLKLEALAQKEISKTKIANSCNLAGHIRNEIFLKASKSNFNKYIGQVRDSFQKKFLPLLSTHSAQTLAAMLKEDTFKLIDTEASIEPVIPDLGLVLNYGPRNPPSKFIFMQQLQLVRQGQEVRCHLNGYLPRDITLQTDEKIYLSKLTIASGSTNTITHELGHWLSLQLKYKRISAGSSAKLEKTRNCIRGFYKNDTSESGYLVKHDGDHLRTEEDFADWFTARAGLDENDMFCDFSKIFPASSEAKYLPVPEDFHSNFLFREMNLRLNKGQALPASCKLVMKQNPDQAPVKCE